MMASGSRKLGPLRDFVPFAELLLIHPENFGTFGSFRVSLWVSTPSPLIPWYRDRYGLLWSGIKVALQSFCLISFFPLIRRDRKVPNFIGSLRVSGIAMNNTHSSFVNSSHRNFSQRYFWTADRDPCEYTIKLSWVPFSRLVWSVTRKVLKPPKNLGNPGPVVILLK